MAGLCIVHVYVPTAPGEERVNDKTLYFSGKDAAENYLAHAFQRMAYDMWFGDDGVMALTREVEFADQMQEVA